MKDNTNPFNPENWGWAEQPESTVEAPGSPGAVYDTLAWMFKGEAEEGSGWWE